MLPSVPTSQVSHWLAAHEQDTLFLAMGSATALKASRHSTAGPVGFFSWWENNFSLSWVPLVYVVTLRQKRMCPSGNFGAMNLVLVPLVRSLELGPWITWPGRLQLHEWGLGGRAMEIEISLILLRSGTGGPGGWTLPYSLALSHPAELWGYGSPESKSSLLTGALIATTCMATSPHLSGELHLEALERAVLLKRLPQQIALGSMAKLEKLPLSQKDQTPWNK